MSLFYYNLTILGSAQEPLTYASSHSFFIGECVNAPLRSHLKPATVLSKVQKPSFKCKEIELSLKEHFSSQQLQIAKFISEYYSASMGESLALMHPYASKDPTFVEFKTTVSLALSPNQKKVKNFLNTHKYSLLFGDTGSGKTEIYLSLMQEVLEEGGSAIFLMPEIGLTPQMQTRLESHFGPRVAVWHSKLTKKKKEKILESIEDGIVRVVAGPRSALFLPLHKLGLIVVDEEHDESYKSASSPRYNARDVALWMSVKLDIKVVLGSATPSLTSYEKLPSIRLRGTYFKSSRQVIYEPGLHTLSEKIISKLKDTLSKDSQAIVFVPTRAHFKTLTCKDCGARVECPFCSVSMSLHRKINALKCHYCNFAEPIPYVCKECGGSTIEASRIGTAQVIDDLEKELPNARIGQFDKDAIKTEKQLKKLLKDFNERKLDILVGTQMLSKGHDYHDISLSVIIGLDSQLAMPDFRSREKALALALQIAGRSGRKGDGEVLIQTLNREFFEAYMDDFELFLKDERIAREGLYPPFTRFSRLLISHKDEQVCKDVLEKTLKKLELFENIEIVGSGAAEISKIANKFRYHILLRSNSPSALLRANHACKSPFVQIDMDPMVFS